MARKKSEQPLDTIYDVQRRAQLDALGEVLLYRLRRFPAVAKFWQRYMGTARPSRTLLRRWEPSPEAAAALDRLSRHMAEAFNTSKADARAAILGNVPPKLQMVRVENSLKTGAGCSATSTITMQVSALATPAEVAAAYQRARRQLLGLGDKARFKPPDVRTVKLARFVVKYDDAETEAGRARWNSQHADQPARCAMNTWRRDLRRAVKQVADPTWLKAAVDSAWMGGLGKHRLDH